MNYKNKYTKRSRISEAKFRELVKVFALDVDAQRIARLTQLTRNTVNRYLFRIRTRIAEFCEHQSPFHGEVEVDESYFGGKRIKGKRGRGASGKTPVLASFNVEEKSIPKSCPIAPKPRCKPLFAVRSIPIASSIPTTGAAITAWWIWGIKSIIESIMGPMNSRGGNPTSTASNPSGPLQKEDS